MNARKIARCLCAITLWLHAPAIVAKSVPAAYKQAETQAVPAIYRADPALAKAIRDAKIVKTDYPLHVLKNGAEVLVTTLLNPQSTDRSAKIDAVLVAKAIMDADKKVLIVHYRTKERMKAPGFSVVTVKQSDVMAYGVNAIGVDSLLGQLKVVKRSGNRGRSQ